MGIFENTEIAFKSKSDKELRKSGFLFRLISYPSLVRSLGTFAGFGISLGLPLRWLVKPVVFSHFCGGENLQEAGEVIEFLAKYNIRSVPDYAAENQKSEVVIRSVINEIIKTMDISSVNPDVPFTVFKPSALAPFNTLKIPAGGRLDSTPKTEEMDRFRERFMLLCRTAREKGTPVMVDAEEYYYQDIIDSLVTEMMELYNRERPIVYNTVQMYRHDRLVFLKESIRIAGKKKYLPGFKIVRGAYMDQERERADRLGYPSPIYPDKESTDRAFNAAIELCLENIGTTSIFVGTHNEESILKLIAGMREHKLRNSDPRIYISQLYGMSDHISFNMAQQSYNVAKYLPYGPVKYLLPYLLRRADENRSVTGQSGRELKLIQQEIRRRKVKNITQSQW